MVELLLRVHAGLTRLVAPATPETLRATQPPPGSQRLLGGMPLIIKGTILAASICLLGFLATVAKTTADEKNASPTPSPSPTATASVSPTPAPSR
jgi:ABC-type uncharacterized transport system involved in gliding motility auxiliary subunit